MDTTCHNEGAQLLLATELSIIIQETSQTFSVFRWKSKNNLFFFFFFSSLKWTKTNKENTNQEGACHLGQVYGTPITSNHKVWRRPAGRNEMGTTAREDPQEKHLSLKILGQSQMSIMTLYLDVTKSGCILTAGTSLNAVWPHGTAGKLELEEQMSTISEEADGVRERMGTKEPWNLKIRLHHPPLPPPTHIHTHNAHTYSHSHTSESCNIMLFYCRQKSFPLLLALASPFRAVLMSKFL